MNDSRVSLSVSYHVVVEFNSGILACEFNHTMYSDTGISLSLQNEHLT